MYNFEVKSPTSLVEALSLMDQYGKDIEPLAGGTDVLIMVRNNLGNWGNVPNVLNMLSIPHMDFINETENAIEIGPTVTHTQVLVSPIIAQHIPALIRAIEYVGSPQIRNLGTIVGNVVRGSPAADTLCLFYTREAKIRVQTVNSTEDIPISEFLVGPGQTTLPENGLVTKVIIPKLPGYKSDYISLRQRNALSIVVISIAIEVLLNEDQSQIDDIRIALGAVAPTIVRAPKTEQLLKNQILSEDLIAQAEQFVTTECVPITDVRSNKKYRQAMTGVLLGRFLREIIKK
ncbi:MAG: FAD binding domain-containing protein [Candidatus Hodarchaeales archaeon]|jgi:carbon-monoxide dehydrogenase medium subunit